MCIRDRGVGAVGRPGKTVVATETHGATGLEDFAAAFSTSFESLLMTVEYPLGQAELLATLHTEELEAETGAHRHVALEQEIQAFVVYESAVLDGVIASSERITDALGGAAVARDFEAVIVRCGDDSVHFLKGHAQRVVCLLYTSSRCV